MKGDLLIMSSEQHLSDFWDPENDWDEGQFIEVIAYTKVPRFLKEGDLEEI